MSGPDADLLAQITTWSRDAFSAADDVPLDEDLRLAATRLGRQQVARLRSLWPEWIAQERQHAGSRGLRGRELTELIFNRALNEMGLWFVDTAGPEQDALWLTLARAPTACQYVPSWPFARLIAMVQAVPREDRPALLAAAEAALLRWGTRRASLPQRPPAAALEAADKAIGQLRAGLQTAAQPMTPYLAGMLFVRDRASGGPDRWERCAKSQWWLTSQLADAAADRAMAVAVFRHARLFDIQDFVPAPYLAKVEPPNPGKTTPGYPRVANFFRVEGSTTVLSELDAQGRLLAAQVVDRKIQVPGVRDNPPVAFEGVFDAATLDYAKRRSYVGTTATKVRTELVWKLSGDDDAAR